MADLFHSTASCFSQQKLFSGDIEDIIKSISLYPSSVLAPSLIRQLPSERHVEAFDIILRETAHYDTWVAFFDLLEEQGGVVTENVALGAVKAVGLDPYSAPLWVRALRAVGSEEGRRHLLQLALSIPLYRIEDVVAAFVDLGIFDTERKKILVDFEEQIQKSVAASEAEPRWPDRFVSSFWASLDEIACVREQWNRLLKSMFQNLQEGYIAHALQLRRIDLALRQLCAQFPRDDMCWQLHATFCTSYLGSTVAARCAVSKGLKSVGKRSAALLSLAQELTADGFETDAAATAEEALYVASDHTSTLVNMRIHGATATQSLLTRKRFRNIGKEAAAIHLCDWHVYSQWGTYESLVLRDATMAAKVFERGAACVSSSLHDLLALTAVATRHHLLRSEERETVGYAEKRIEQAMESGHGGQIHAVWNHLVECETQLGLPSVAKTARRRSVVVSHSSLFSLVSKFRVGNHLPCSDSEFRWLRLAHDYYEDRRRCHDHTAPRFFSGKSASLPASQICTKRPSERPPSAAGWVPADAVLRQFKQSVSTTDPDEVVGPRYFRGLLVHKVSVSDHVASRLQREERLRSRKKPEAAEDEVAVLAPSLQQLLYRVKRKTFGSYNSARCETISSSWLMALMTEDELDLQLVLKQRRLAQQLTRK